MIETIRNKWLRRALLIAVMPLIIVVALFLVVLESIVAIAHDLADDIRNAWKGKS